MGRYRGDLGEMRLNEVRVSVRVSVRVRFGITARVRVGFRVRVPAPRLVALLLRLWRELASGVVLPRGTLPAHRRYRGDIGDMSEIWGGYGGDIGSPSTRYPPCQG